MAGGVARSWMAAGRRPGAGGTRPSSPPRWGEAGAAGGDRPAAAAAVAASPPGWWRGSGWKRRAGTGSRGLAAGSSRPPRGDRAEGGFQGRSGREGREEQRQCRGLRGPRGPGLQLTPRSPGRGGRVSPSTEWRERAVELPFSPCVHPNKQRDEGFAMSPCLIFQLWKLKEPFHKGPGVGWPRPWPGVPSPACPAKRSSAKRKAARGIIYSALSRGCSG